MAKAQSKRELILDIAEASVLSKGFGGTSIDEIISAADITKSGFFYHFRDKNQLARALLQRYLDTENAILDDIFDRARDLHGDPLHSFLIGLKLFAELMEDLPNGHPGCLVATVAYSERMFDQEVRDLNRQAILTWRERFLGVLKEIAAIYPPRDDVDLMTVADMITGTVEGGIVLSRAVGETAVLPQQIVLLRSYIRLLFSPAL
ncbi:TetR/AcrR family transcriptional regulator [Roseibium marinum]|uniref:AcrR family transcriptional regulator n=1 Tax=Roseibium marinum TaxID=281252 RepID=A0A2S3UZ49_9HYPH|nr:TetR/AcrR family transcriptional regulator [Roseibium marinum]POF32987.1 AcrR family transcriptional regulator [Roseibium marinum]